jgi:hypothetical protein
MHRNARLLRFREKNLLRYHGAFLTSCGNFLFLSPFESLLWLNFVPPPTSVSAAGLLGTVGGSYHLQAAAFPMENQMELQRYAGVQSNFVVTTKTAASTSGWEAADL